MKKQFCILAISLISLSSCFFISPPMGSYSPYCYDGKNTGLDTLLNLNGYYLIDDSIDDNGNIKPLDKRTYEIIIFYKDGFFTHFISSNNFDFGERWNDWGLYKIYNDTLKVRFTIPRGKKWRPGSESWYKIVDKNTIESLMIAYWGGITEDKVRKLSENKNKFDSYGKFISCDTLPDPNKTHVKKDRVFWCSKEQYKKWKQEQKLKRKHKK